MGAHTASVKRYGDMSKVFEFPNASVRNDADIEKGLREGLSNHGFSENAVDAAIDAVMPLMREAKSTTAKGLEFSLNTSLSAKEVENLKVILSLSLKEYQSEVSEFVKKLIVKIAILEASANSV